jgi:hypothetical protein
VAAKETFVKEQGSDVATICKYEGAVIRFVLQMKDHKSPLGSVYALDISGDAKIIAVGSPEGYLRITDARQPEKYYKLGGHTDNVR